MVSEVVARFGAGVIGRHSCSRRERLVLPGREWFAYTTAWSGIGAPPCLLYPKIVGIGQIILL